MTDERPPQPADDEDWTPTEALGPSAGAPRGSWRARMRARPGVREAYRLGVFLAGLVFIALGAALVALPGPLTIPPVLLGLWIWSTEFAFAERFFDSFKEKAQEAWDHAKRHPRSSALVTGGGIVAAALAIWAAAHFDLVQRARDAVL